MAAFPLMLATIMPLVARIVPQFLVPSLLRFGYTTDELVLLVVLLAGTAVGAGKGFPVWSYVWVVLGLASIVAFLTSFLPVILYDVMDFRAVSYGWLFTIAHLLGGLLVLVFAASRSNGGLGHPFFVAAVYLVSIALRVYLLEPTVGISPAGLIAANSFSILVMAIELMVVLAAVAHFLAGDAVAQRRSTYVLLAVALLDPLFAGWGLAFASAGTGDIINLAGAFFAFPVLARWVNIAVALLLTWGLTIWFIRIRKAKVIGPSHSGGAHAC